MEKQEFKSKWDELAREIGAEISPEIEQREQEASIVAESANFEPKPVAKEENVYSPPPKKAAADWDVLAGELGLPPVPREEPVAEANAEAVVPDRPVFRESLTPMTRTERREPRDEREPRRSSEERHERSDDRGDRGGRRRRDSDREDGERSRRPRGGHSRRGERARGREEGGRGREESGRGREEHRRRREPREFEQREPREFEELEQQQFEEFEPREYEEGEPVEASGAEAAQLATPPQEPSPPEPPARSPAVSLWHKIFGSPAEQTAKLSEPAPGEPAWNEIRAEETSVVSESMEVIAEEDRAGGEFADMSDRGERTGFAEDEVPSEERKRGRRRRRRGGRGRRSGERHSDRSAVPLQQESEGIDDLGVELEDDESESDESLSFAGGVEGASSDLDVDDANGDAAENGIRTKSAAAKAIPSWDEAIGFIVDSNMQSRSQRRPPSRSGNGHRGRPRGRRKN